MNSRTRILNALIGGALVACSSAASAQYYPYPPPPPPRPGSIADDIARGAASAAQAAGAIAVAVRGTTDAVRGTLYGYGYHGSAERFAVNACGSRAQQHGRVNIGEVYPQDRRSWRVNGFVDRPRTTGSRYSYGGSLERRTFACTVRSDGKITKFKTKRLRY